MPPSALSPAQRTAAQRQIRAELEAEGVDVDAELAKRFRSSRIDFETPPAWLLKHAGQLEAWNAQVRYLRIMAGWQSGKTDFLVWWCLRQMGRKGPGEALVFAPTHPLLSVALEPRLVKAVESRGLGVHKASDNYILLPADSLRRIGWEGGRGELVVFIRHTMEAKYVESVTALWAAGDECGQMSDEVGEAIDGRLSATGGDACLISRYYNDNWFSRACQEPDVPGFSKTVSFASWANPGWRKDLRETPGALEAEVERLRRSMPAHRFAGKYAGQITKPAGLIYDCCTDKAWDDPEEPGHLEPAFLVPPYWERCYAVDFGSVHTCVRCYAKDPVLKSLSGLPVWHNYRTYYPNQARQTTEHVRLLEKWEREDALAWLAAGGWKEHGRAEVQWPPLAFGGNAGNEAESRELWTLAGLPVQEPYVSGVTAGIDCVYDAYADRRILVFDTLSEARASKRRYSWKLDGNGDPLPGEIEDKKVWHFEDAERYFVPFTEAECVKQASRYGKQEQSA